MTNPKLATSNAWDGRTYRHPVSGDKVPSITTVIGQLDKPALVPWAAGLVADAVLDDLDEWRRLAEEDRAQTRRTLVALPRKRADEAATRGTSIHDWLQVAADGGDVAAVEADLSLEAKTFLPSAAAFLRQWNPEYLHTERSVFGDGFAGTGDAWAYMPGIGLAVIDFKTGADGRKLYPEIALQLAALRFADEMAMPDDTIIAPPAVECGVGVLIMPGSYRVHRVAADIRTYQVFRALLQVYHWRRREGLVGDEVFLPDDRLPF